jgi:hypothetical protein
MVNCRVGRRCFDFFRAVMSKRVHSCRCDGGHRAVGAHVLVVASNAMGLAYSSL